jgi:hypothetical protein
MNISDGQRWLVRLLPLKAFSAVSVSPATVVQVSSLLSSCLQGNSIRIFEIPRPKFGFYQTHSHFLVYLKNVKKSNQMAFFILTQEVWYRINQHVKDSYLGMSPLYYNTEYWLSKHEWPFPFQQCKQIHSLPWNMLETRQLLDINFKLSSPQVLRHDSNTKFVSFMEVSVRPLLHKTWLKLCNQASMFHKFYDCTAGSSKLMWEFTAWDKKIGMTINIHTPHGHRLKAFVAFRRNVMRSQNWPENLATNSRHCQSANRFLNLPARRGSCSMKDWIHPC